MLSVEGILKNLKLIESQEKKCKGILENSELIESYTKNKIEGILENVNTFVYPCVFIWWVSGRILKVFSLG